MATLLNRNGTYYADIQDARRTPGRRRLSLKTTSKRAALRMLAKLEEAYALGTWDPWVQTVADLLQADRQAAPKRLDEAVAEFMKGQEEQAAPSTLNAYRSYTALFVSTVGAATFVERVTAADVERFVVAVGGSKRPPSQGSKRQRLTVAKSFFSWAKGRGYVKEKPTDRVPRPPRPARLPKAVMDDELEAILAALPDGRAWMRPLFLFASLTGLRVSELCRLQWEQVDVGRRVLRIERQKNGRAQTQPVPRSALDVLMGVERRGPHVFTAPNAYAPRRRVDSWIRDVEAAFKEAKEAAGIERGITPHGLRHRYCTKLAEAGAGAFVIAAAARHSDPRTSAVYVSIANEALKAQLDDVFG